MRFLRTAGSEVDWVSAVGEGAPSVTETAGGLGGRSAGFTPQAASKAPSVVAPAVVEAAFRKSRRDIWDMVTSRHLYYKFSKL
jgi:hypothetical protein